MFSLTEGLAGFQEPHEGNVENGEDPAPVASPNVPGHEAIRLALPAGGKRSELRPEEAAQQIRAGERHFFGYSAFLPEDFPVDFQGFQVIWQLHDGGANTSPPVALEVQQGRLWLANVGELVQDLGPVTAGENLAVQMEIEFAQGGGTVSVWRDGREVLTDFAPPQGTMIDDFDYLKTGLYRSESGDAPATELFLNDLKIGDSLESVSGLAGDPAPGGSGAGQVAGSAASALLGAALPIGFRRLRSRQW